VIVHSVETGEALRTLSAHTDTVTSVCMNPSNPMQLLTASLDGTLRAWDFVDGVELDVWTVAKPVIDMVAVAATGQLCLVVVKRKKKKKKKKKKKQKKNNKAATRGAASAESDASSSDTLQMRWVVYDLATRAQAGVLAKSLGSWHGPKPSAESFYFVRQQSRSRYVVVASRRCGVNTILVFDAADRAQGVRSVAHCRRITCLAIHPSLSYVVAGDEEGQIAFFHCLGSRSAAAASGSAAAGADARHRSSKRRRLSSSGDASSGGSAPDGGAPSKRWHTLTSLERKLSEATSALHWHAFGVRCLAFSPDGAYLLSGGEEAVLVSWQLDTGERDFLPRMGSALCGIAIGGRGGSTYAVSLHRNVVLAIDAGARKVRWKIHGLELAKAARSIDDFAFQPQLASSRAATGSAEGSGSAGVPSTPLRTLVLDTQSALAQGADGPLLVLNGAPGTGSIQLWGLGTGRHVDSLQAAPRNMVTVADRTLAGLRGQRTQRSAREKVHQLPVSMVRHACFSFDGSGLVTIDHRDVQEPEAGGFSFGAEGKGRASSTRCEPPEELTLRFWRLGSATRRYQLHTWVQRPHQGAITRLVYHPTQHIAVTTSCDRTFKLWHRVNFGDDEAAAGAKKRSKSSALTLASKQSGADVPKYAWVCRSIGSFRDALVRPSSLARFARPSATCVSFPAVPSPPLALASARSSPYFYPPAHTRATHHSAQPIDASFSGDGSLLVIAFGAVVTLWNPTTNVLLQTLTQGFDPLRSARIIGSSRFLVAVSGDAMTLWDLFTLRARWTRNASASAFAADEQSALFAIAVPVPAADGVATRVSIFDGEADTPMREWTVPHAAVHALSFVHSPAGASLLLLDDRWELHQVALDGDGSAFGAVVPHTAAPTATTVFSQLFAKTSGEEGIGAAGGAAPRGTTAASTAAAVATLFSGPSHTLPPIETLFPAFISAVASKKTSRPSTPAGAAAPFGAPASDVASAALFSSATRAAALRAAAAPAPREQARRSAATLALDESSGIFDAIARTFSAIDAAVETSPAPAPAPASRPGKRKAGARGASAKGAAKPASKGAAKASGSAAAPAPAAKPAARKKTPRKAKVAAKASPKTPAAPPSGARRSTRGSAAKSGSAAKGKGTSSAAKTPRSTSQRRSTRKSGSGKKK
jgi:NET1-associated nuclear protein 1 (U3 small nucleolar RNA-associated protein 17)